MENLLKCVFIVLLKSTTGWTGFREYFSYIFYEQLTLATGPGVDRYFENRFSADCFVSLVKISVASYYYLLPLPPGTRRLCTLPSLTVLFIEIFVCISILWVSATKYSLGNFHMSYRVVWNLLFYCLKDVLLALVLL